MAKEEMIKQAFIAGAGSALTYKEKHPNATESKIMSYVTKEMQKLLRDIEED
jgi:hypothetical protein